MDYTVLSVIDLELEKKKKIMHNLLLQDHVVAPETKELRVHRVILYLHLILYYYYYYIHYL